MIQPKTPKKIRGARKKKRQLEVERLKTKFPIWFANKSDKEANILVSKYLLTNPASDDEFPSFVIKWEAQNN